MNDATITLPGLPAMVSVARKYCRAFFDGSPRLDTIELIGAELSANSLRHTADSEKDGWFAIRTIRRDDWARIEVADQGTGRWVRMLAPPDEEEETGRGLTIVIAVADRAGHDRTKHGQRMWAEVSWTDPLTTGGLPYGLCQTPEASGSGIRRARAGLWRTWWTSS